MFDMLGILLIITNFTLADFALGPYEVLLKQLGKCTNEGTKELHLQNGKIIKTSRRKFALSGNLIFLSDLDNKHFNLDLDIAAMGNGVWREHYYYQKCGKFCDSFKSLLPNFFRNFIKSAGLSCSKNIQKGNYTLDRVDLSLDFHLPFIPYNQYKVDVVFFKQAKRIGCLQFFTDVIPKRNS